jgi:hypothetical protein
VIEETIAKLASGQSASFGQLLIERSHNFDHRGQQVQIQLQ